jgi:NADH:ubiquinone oxidoreductase subunit 6 (subunit J)
MELNSILFVILAGLTGACAVAVVLTQNIVRAAAWLLFTLAGTAGVFFLLSADFVGATQLLVYVGGTLVLVVFGVMLTAQGPFINMRVGAAEWAIALGVGLLLYGVLAICLVQMQPPTAAQAHLALFRITGKSIESLRAAEVPDEALEKLNALKNKDFTDRQDFLAELGKVLDPDEFARFQDRVLKSAAFDMPGAIPLGEALLGSDTVTPEAQVTGIPGTPLKGETARSGPGRPPAVLGRNRTRIAYLLPFEIVSVHLLVVLIGAAYLARAKRRRGSLSAPVEARA